MDSLTRYALLLFIPFFSLMLLGAVLGYMKISPFISISTAMIGLLSPLLIVLARYNSEQFEHWLMR